MRKPYDAVSHALPLRYANRIPISARALLAEKAARFRALARMAEQKAKARRLD